MKSVFLILFLFAFNAWAYTYEVAPGRNMKLDPKIWDHGKGSFGTGTLGQTPIYSNKKEKDLQIVYEDLFLIDDKVSSRLPKECGAVPKKPLQGKFVCRYKTNEVAIDKTSLMIVSFFKTNEPNVVRVRSTYVIGSASSINKINQNISGLLKDYKNVVGSKK